MKKTAGIRFLATPTVLDPQRFFNQKIISKSLTHKDRSKNKNLIRYMVTILYKKPEFGEGVSFHSTYRVIEEKDPLIIKHIFGDAFHLAHPSWIVEEVTVKED